ncbi:hypothetical protein ACVWZL_003323 [Bradyrhizobium sp. GM2.4]
MTEAASVAASDQFSYALTKLWPHGHRHIHGLR